MEFVWVTPHKEVQLLWGQVTLGAWFLPSVPSAAD